MTKLNIKAPINGTKSAHIFRQVNATFAACLLSITGGITFGFTSVLLPQMKDDESFPYDKNFDSWIASMSPFAMIMGCLFSGSLSDLIGRKMGLIALDIPFSIGWIIMGFSNNNILMLIGRFITGLCTGALIPNTMVYIGELSEPKYRSIALFSLSTSIYIGILVSHTVGKYVYWKISCFLFTTPNIISLILLVFSRESPLWLLSKNRINEGTESFKFFRGSEDSSEQELDAVIKENKEKRDKTSLKDMLRIIFSKPFMRSVLIVFLLFIATQWCGVNTISFYAQEIFEKTFSDDIDPFVLMLITDFIRAVAAVAVCFLAKFIPRKTTFVICCFSITIVLVGLLIYLYIRPAGLVWIAVTCMIIYIGIAGIVTCISWSFLAEIFPAKMRGFGSGLSSGISFALLFIAVKVTPEFLTNFGELAMYASFAISTLFSGTCLMFLLPETNGKSLQEIEDALYKEDNVAKPNIDAIIVTKL